MKWYWWLIFFKCSNIDELSEIVKDDIAQGTLRTTIDDNLETSSIPKFEGTLTFKFPSLAISDTLINEVNGPIIELVRLRPTHKEINNKRKKTTKKKNPNEIFKSVLLILTV